MSPARGDLAADPPARRAGVVAVLSVAVAVVLGDSGVVTLALPEILRDFGADVAGVAWVLIAFNLVLALVAVPAARLCLRGDPAVAVAGGVTRLRGRDHGVRVGRVAGRADRGPRGPGGRGRAGDRRKSRAARCRDLGPSARALRRWAAAGVAGAALGPVIGGLLTSAFSWRAIFVAQIPVMLITLPAAIALRGHVVPRPAKIAVPRRIARTCWPTLRWRCCRRRSPRRCSCWCCCLSTAGRGHRPWRRSPSPRCRCRLWRPAACSAGSASGPGQRRSLDRC